MNFNSKLIEEIDIEIVSLNTVIVGSGAAGLNAADCLYNLGQKDIAIVTEGLKMGTSRNAGSDKQTYYKLTLAGDGQDSVTEMAKDLFAGGCMHGDIAIVEAALSTRAFYKLVELGVPFPHNEYGEYAGYKTDHDPRQRATSAGPLTSRYMTEKLEEQVIKKGIKIFDGYQVIGILTKNEISENKIIKKAVGCITLNINKLSNQNYGVTIFNCTNIIYATGGPAGIYASSVYPESQTGASGIAFEAGVRGVNLTESQYGIASTKFRWNLSGTYQQVIPRYFSVNQNGTDEKEFLNEHFKTPGKMLDAIFLKGYQWPFDSRKILHEGSSLIDLLVYIETKIKGRRVFIDYKRNPSCSNESCKLDFSLLGEEAYTYLEKSGALLHTPIERLKKINQPAVDLYRSNGIDLENEYLEIDVCAQHTNGGLVGNIWWESNVLHLFPVGEVNGTFGVYRPGGSALNSTQVGSLRAAEYICANYMQNPPDINTYLENTYDQIIEKIHMIKAFIKNKSQDSNIVEIRRRAQHRMSLYGAQIRSLKGLIKGLDDCRNDLSNIFKNTKISSVFELPYAFQNRDILITQFLFFCSIIEYITYGGKSRGSYLISKAEEMLSMDELEQLFHFQSKNEVMNDIVCEIEFRNENDKFLCNTEWKPVRQLPKRDFWFESVWNKYMATHTVK